MHKQEYQNPKKPVCLDVLTTKFYQIFKEDLQAVIIVSQNMLQATPINLQQYNNMT